MFAPQASDAERLTRQAIANRKQNAGLGTEPLDFAAKQDPGEHPSAWRAQLPWRLQRVSLRILVLYGAVRLLCDGDKRVLQIRVVGYQKTDELP